MTSHAYIKSRSHLAIAWQIHVCVVKRQGECVVPATLQAHHSCDRGQCKGISVSATAWLPQDRAACCSDSVPVMVSAAAIAV